MDNKSCAYCRKTKTLLICGPCAADVCKACAEFVPEGTFALMATVPPELQHTVFCPSCYQQNLAGALAEYQGLVEQAKEIMIFNKSQGKETRFIRRNEDWIEFRDCEDENEGVMKLAFHAVQIGCNAVIDVEVMAQKIRLGSYQTQKFHVKGRPAQVKDSQLVKDRSIWSKPN